MLLPHFSITVVGPLLLQWPFFILIK